MAATTSIRRFADQVLQAQEYETQAKGLPKETDPSILSGSLVALSQSVALAKIAVENAEGLDDLAKRDLEAIETHINVAFAILGLNKEPCKKEPCKAVVHSPGEALSKGWLTQSKGSFGEEFILGRSFDGGF